MNSSSKETKQPKANNGSRSQWVNFKKSRITFETHKFDQENEANVKITLTADIFGQIKANKSPRHLRPISEQGLLL